jgi:hypothetical protein
MSALVQSMNRCCFPSSTVCHSEDPELSLSFHSTGKRPFFPGGTVSDRTLNRLLNSLKSAAAGFGPV